MFRRAALPLSLLILAGGAVAQPGGGGGWSDHGPRGPHFFTEPSDVIAAEIAFARRAQEKGQWRAYRETMAAGAVMFVPQRVDAAPWLKGRKEPAEAAHWQPRAVSMACDGSAALVSGVWQDGATHGWFASIWRRQKDGSYKWVLQDADASTAPQEDSDTITAHVADCARHGERAKSTATPPATGDSGEAGDGSLRWQATTQAGGAHTLVVWMRKDGAMQKVWDNAVSAVPN